MITLFVILILLSVLLPLLFVYILWKIVTNLIEKIVIAIIEFVFGLPVRIFKKIAGIVTGEDNEDD